MELNARFRGYLPVVIDVETGGFDRSRHALLQIAIVLLEWENEQLHPSHTQVWNLIPHADTEVEDASLKITGIDLNDSSRNAISEGDAIQECFRVVRRAVRDAHCQRAIVTAHNGHFDLGFLSTGSERNNIKRNPFHPFSVIDTASLAAVAFGHTVLSEACTRAGIDFNEENAHSAEYDAEATAALFCRIVNASGFELPI
ncbi:MAG: ribonuclease T [Gammaproteobacteria bacterium]|nr:MAG: ribonuclease T [Gammaproteobacteria bacterium]